MQNNNDVRENYGHILDYMCTNITGGIGYILQIHVQIYEYTSVWMHGMDLCVRLSEFVYLCLCPCKIVPRRQAGRLCVKVAQ